jgi:regulator of G-protein signaling
MLNDTNGLKIFAEFLKKEFSGENIYFWTACERYRQICDETERRREALAIYERHLANGALEPVNVDSNARNNTRERLSNADRDLFSSAQKQIFNLMKFDSYQRFIRSDLYKSCIDAEQKNTPMPYASENLDPLLCVSQMTTSACNINGSNNNIASKLKKSLSNAEDRRRKSLLPWHRKSRCKSKDRDEENLSKKASTSSSNTLKHNSNHSIGDIHSSRSSLSSFDATIAKISSFDDETRNSLCRVILRENGATTIVQIKSDESIRDLIERVLDKRGFSYQAFEAFLSGTNKVHFQAI